MNVHALVKEREAQALVVAGLKAMYKDLPRPVRLLYDHLQSLKSLEAGIRELENTVELERKTAPDTPAGRWAIKEAETALKTGMHTYENARWTLNHRLAASHLTLADLEQVNELRQAMVVAERRLSDLEGALIIADQDAGRKNIPAAAFRLNSGRSTSADVRAPSLAYRFAHAWRKP